MTNPTQSTSTPDSVAEKEIGRSKSSIIQQQQPHLLNERTNSNISVSSQESLDSTISSNSSIKFNIPQPPQQQQQSTPQFINSSSKIKLPNKTIVSNSKESLPRPILFKNNSNNSKYSNLPPLDTGTTTHSSSSNNSSVNLNLPVSTTSATTLTNIISKTTTSETLKSDTQIESSPLINNNNNNKLIDAAFIAPKTGTIASPITSTTTISSHNSVSSKSPPPSQQQQQQNLPILQNKQRSITPERSLSPTPITSNNISNAKNFILKTSINNTIRETLNTPIDQQAYPKETMLSPFPGLTSDTSLHKIPASVLAQHHHQQQQQPVAFPGSSSELSTPINSTPITPFPPNSDLLATPKHHSSISFQCPPLGSKHRGSISARPSQTNIAHMDSPTTISSGIPSSRLPVNKQPTSHFPMGPTSALSTPISAGLPHHPLLHE
ncbi:unnamed protein product [[Candida] boidinii]|uniref:Unnamed protein product n=1 Tax=Candida boidinii TaxID=5477 RepID=A0A9W6T3J4_CANBO|nr:unnamed protein product [[Candida] boidinii]